MTVEPKPKGQSEVRKYEIQADVTGEEDHAIEVVVTMHDGSRRWCYFMTPKALSESGDRLERTGARLHFGSPHLVVVSTLSEEVIAETLELIERRGEIGKCTIPCLEPK